MAVAARSSARSVLLSHGVFACNRAHPVLRVYLCWGYFSGVCTALFDVVFSFLFLSSCFSVFSFGVVVFVCSQESPSECNIANAV